MPARGQRTYTEAQLRDAVAASTTIREVLVRLGLSSSGNYPNVRRAIAEFGIDASHIPAGRPRGKRCRPTWCEDIDESNLRAVVEASRTLVEAIRRLGGDGATSDYRWLHRLITQYGVTTSHLVGRSWARAQPRPELRTPMEELLVVGPLRATSMLKRRLIEEGLKERRCELCRSEMHDDLPIPLELDHINGNRRDNRFENLRLLCPNCHALTDTYRGRNIGRAR